jgi:purine-binding chemotaxis protein CheW
MTKQARERGKAPAGDDAREVAKEEPRTGTVAAETAVMDIHNAGSQGDQGGQSGRGAESGTQLVTFLLKDEEFGFDIMSVQEIIRLPKMARLPHTPEYVEGISNLRGAVLPIIDIRARFGMEREARTERSRVLVLDIDGRRTGLLVDGVRQVASVGQNEFERPPAAIRNGTTDYVSGVVKLDNGERIIIALDARRVCQPEQASGGLDISGRKDGAPAGSPRDSKENQTRTEAPALEHSDPDTVKPGIGGDMHQLVSFQVGREEFAFPMEDVREILRVQTPKEVPGAPEHLLGVLTVRGRILPIVDLRRLLKLQSFAAEHVAASRVASAAYTDFLGTGAPDERPEAGRKKGARSNEGNGTVAASEQLRSWLAGFNSSSQVLMETIAQIRGLNEQVAKQAGAGDSASPHGEIAAAAKAVVKALSTFQRQVESYIREDQRIIVVDSNGFLLGLVVDHVNEVLGVREEAIETPPSLGKHEGVGLSGIAKLDDGNRLILLLDTSDLLDGEHLAEIAGGLEKTAGREQTQITARAEGGASDYELQLVTFLLGQEEYGIPIASIQEIDRLSKITQTPKAPKFVEGVTNLRGEVIPVLSTRTLFALEAKAADDRTRVIIVDLGGAKTGLVVDSVKEVMSISSRNVAPPPASITNGGDGQFISGIGKVDEGKRMIVLLDVARVLTRGEQGEVAALGRTA